MQNLLEKLDINLIDRIFFNDAKIDRIQFFKDTKILSLNLSLKRSLPFALYNETIESIERITKVKCELIITSEECDLVQKDLQHYINFSIDKKRLHLLSENRISLDNHLSMGIDIQKERLYQYEQTHNLKYYVTTKFVENEGAVVLIVNKI